MAILDGIEVFAWYKPKYVSRVYRTERMDHPGGRMTGSGSPSKGKKAIRIPY